jgi:hypothetical protein
MKSILIVVSIFITAICFGQSDATTTLSTMLLDREIPLNQKNKKTHSNHIILEVPTEFWNQFERVDAVFISAWSGSGAAGKAQYDKDILKMDPGFTANPLLYFAEKAPAFFHYPRTQTGFGTELAIFAADADTACLNRYNKSKIAPKGIFSCLVERFVSTTPVNFFYRYALPKQYYSAGKSPKLKLMLRCSSKKDTVLLDTKIALTVMGKRQQSVREISMSVFLKDAVLNGLKAEGFPLNHARWVMENPKVFFVGKCQICTPVRAAFEEYISSYQEIKTTSDQKLLDALVLGKVEEKQIALSKIINMYVENHFKKLDMNPREKNSMISNLETARNLGMNLKSAEFGKFCPSCDGACGIKK